MEYTYEQIKPLIKKEELEGQQMKVSFQAIGQDTAIDSIGVMIPEKSDMMKSVAKSAVKQGIFSAIIRSVSGLLGGAIGGTAGSVARSATSQVGYAATRSTNSTADIMNVKDTPENRQKAVVSAFNSVASFYEYDSSANKWSAKNMTPPGA